MSTPQEEANELRDELTVLLCQPCFDDVMIFMFASNLKDGKVWANYQCLKDFFRELRYGAYGPISELSEDVRNVLARLSICPDIDHSMTRVMGLSGLFSYTCNVGDDYLYMSEEQQTSALDRSDGMKVEDVRSLKKVAYIYGDYLESIGR